MKHTNICTYTLCNLKSRCKTSKTPLLMKIRLKGLSKLTRPSSVALLLYSTNLTRTTLPLSCLKHSCTHADSQPEMLPLCVDVSACRRRKQCLGCIVWSSCFIPLSACAAQHCLFDSRGFCLPSKSVHLMESRRHKDFQQVSLRESVIYLVI